MSVPGKYLYVEWFLKEIFITENRSFTRKDLIGGDST